MKQVGCERPDGMLNIHPGSETCDVCAAVSSPETEPGVPHPDVEKIQREWENRVGPNGYTANFVIMASREIPRVLAALAAAEARCEALKNALEQLEENWRQRSKSYELDQQPYHPRADALRKCADSLAALAALLREPPATKEPDQR